MTHLIPNFCFECGTGAPVPFTQSTGSFSGHSVANLALHTIDADISGNLSFIGPTDVLDISHDPPAGDFLSEAVQWSGLLTITQANRVLFNGTVGGAGVGSVNYEINPTGATRLGGYQFAFNGLAETPEPASIADGYAVAKVLSSRMGVRRLWVLPNQVSSAREALRTGEAARGA